MRVYVLRHGIAENIRPGIADAGRALTRDGVRKLRAVLERARRVGVAPALILTSPYKRAAETARIAAEILGYNRRPVKTDTLLPSSTPLLVWKEICSKAEKDLMLVGHEPLLSHVTGFLLDCPDLAMDLKKGALVRIDVEATGAEPHGVLKWMLTPKLAGG